MVQNEQRLGAWKILIALAGGIITIEIFRYAISLALESRYGINTDTYYLGNFKFSFINALTLIISSFIGGFFAGSITKKKGWLFGCLVVITPAVLTAIFVFLSLLGKSLTPSGNVWLQHRTLDIVIWSAIQLLPCLFGGIVGEKMSRGEFTQASTQQEYVESNHVQETGILNFHFALRWRLLFTIPFLAVCFYIFIYYLGNASLIFRYSTIGLLYLLLHPSLWLYWYLFPIWVFLFGFLFTPIFLSLRAPEWVYEIANKNVKVSKKIFQLAVLLIAIVLGTSLANWIGHIPIIWSLNHVTSRGVDVWPILLDKETSPVTYYRLAVVHQKMGKEEKSSMEFEKAYRAYCDLGEYLIRKKSYSSAIEAYNGAIGIYPEHSEPRYYLGIALYKIGQFESAISEYNNALLSYPHSFALNVNLALAYEKTDKDRATEQWKKSLDVANSYSIPKEITSWIYDYVYNPNEVRLTRPMESYLNSLPLEK